MSDEMLYDPSVINPLVESLKSNFGQLQIAGEDLGKAATQLETSWDSNDSMTGFKEVHGRWDREYADSLHTLNQVAIAVENAMHNALGADKKIGDGFGGI
ncbi:WXG100 family type VII secretion target [Nocardia sp. NPDC058058]|uniref:WXG100 family type VII secretion target n=1 Tax=Nocardia sp. NPDC058058 TaxID=3346317 RepID=UPI0036DD35E2